MIGWVLRNTLALAASSVYAVRSHFSSQFYVTLRLSLSDRRAFRVDLGGQEKGVLASIEDAIKKAFRKKWGEVRAGQRAKSKTRG